MALAEREIRTQIVDVKPYNPDKEFGCMGALLVLKNLYDRGDSLIKLKESIKQDPTSILVAHIDSKIAGFIRKTKNPYMWEVLVNEKFNNPNILNKLCETALVEMNQKNEDPQLILVRLNKI